MVSRIIPYMGPTFSLRPCNSYFPIHTSEFQVLPRHDIVQGKGIAKLESQTALNCTGRNMMHATQLAGLQAIESADVHVLKRLLSFARDIQHQMCCMFATAGSTFKSSALKDLSKVQITLHMASIQ